MKSRVLLGRLLVGAGLLILVFLAVAHFYAVRQGTLQAFDDGGWRVLVPFVGTLCLGSGLFVLALSGGRER